jgi:hypothetical protein
MSAPHQPPPHRYSAPKVIDDIKAGRDITITQRAIIEGDFILSSVEVRGIVQFEHVEFQGRVDCSHSTFHNVVSFKHSTFVAENEIAGFNSATFKKDIFLEDATFAGQVDFSHSLVEGVLHSNGATFKKAATFSGTHFYKSVYFDSVFKKDACFIGADFKGNAYFSNAKFHANVLFSSTQITGTADFGRAYFAGKADFNGIQIGKGLICGELAAQGTEIASIRVKFDGEVDFTAAQIGTNADFDNAQFMQAASFNSIHVGGYIRFNGATFESNFDFTAAKVGSNAQFTDTGFKSGEVSFNSIQIDGNLICLNTIFECQVNFRMATVNGGVSFNKARFNEPTIQFNNDVSDSCVDLAGIKVYGPIKFVDAIFGQKADLRGSHFYKDIEFKSTTFSKSVDLSNVTCLGTIFLNENSEFRDTIRLDGTTYYNIEPLSHWKYLLKPQRIISTTSFNLQPFTHLEMVLNRSGEDQLANDVYYEGQRRHSETITLESRQFGLWLKDRFLWLVTGYGIKLERLLILSLLILILSAFAFLSDGAVVTDNTSPETVKLNWLEAFGFSVNQFLPISIPFGDNWIPSSKSLDIGLSSVFFATIIKIIGWILVPIGVSGLAGWLKRD